MFPSFLRVSLRGRESAIGRLLPLGVIWGRLSFFDADLCFILRHRSRFLVGQGIFTISFFLPQSGMVVGLEGIVLFG